MSAQPLPPHHTNRHRSIDSGWSSTGQQIISCGRCESRWTGLNAAHCAACHETFTSVSAFDQHRTGSHAKGTRHCLTPTDVGLVPADREWKGWSLPGSWSGPR